MSRRLFASLFAGALMVPHAALGGSGTPPSATQAESFSLPQIPYAETIPWLAHDEPTKVRIPKVLLTPRTLEFAAIRLEGQMLGFNPPSPLVTSPVSLTTPRPQPALR